MSSYNELIKNFEKIRAYMREFYVYGFKSRDEYNKKSARSYDDGKRRLESWLGEHMCFERDADGKRAFISIDSRTVNHNPLYRAWKAKSFTDGDITLHFILFDILRSGDDIYTLSEIMEKLDSEYLSAFENPMVFDESTVRKKLNEYEKEGLVITCKHGKTKLYSRSVNTDITPLSDMLNFYSEVLPCGVIGSFLLDKLQAPNEIFTFKHHYITGTLDSEILAKLFSAMREKRAVTFKNYSKGKAFPAEITAIPLKIMISSQNGRQYLIARSLKNDFYYTYRLDNIEDVESGEPVEDFDYCRELLCDKLKHVWGVNFRQEQAQTERVVMDIHVSEDEQYIVNRLEREKKCGEIIRVDNNTYRFTAEVYDSSEMLPWIRTFICRIKNISFSNKELEEYFRNDLRRMYELYSANGGEE